MILLNVRWICHWLVLVCADAGDHLQLIKDFEATMIQDWTFFKKVSKGLKYYIKTAMQIKEFENLSKDKVNKVI